MLSVKKRIKSIVADKPGALLCMSMFKYHVASRQTHCNQHHSRFLKINVEQKFCALFFYSIFMLDAVKCQALDKSVLTSMAPAGHHLPISSLWCLLFFL